MALADSMFLIELVVEELKSFSNCNEFSITAQFSDVFTLHLRDPNMIGEGRFKGAAKSKRKQKVRSGKITRPRLTRDTTEPKVETGQTILFESEIELLLSNMEKHPMELSLYSKEEPDYKLGSTSISWNSVYFDYLKKIASGFEPSPVIVSASHTVFEEFSSKKVACVTLNIKLSHLRHKIKTPFRPLSEEYKQAFIMYKEHSMKLPKKTSVKLDDPGTIKTIYSGRKGNYKKINHTKCEKLQKELPELVQNNAVEEEAAAEIISDSQKNRKTKKSIISFVRSDTDIESKQKSSLIRSKSFSSIDYKERMHVLNYIFGHSGPFGNQVYYVGYFTVEPDPSENQPTVPHGPRHPLTATGTPKSFDCSQPDSGPKNPYQYQLCDNDCTNKIGACHSVCSLDLPQEAKDLITVTRCKELTCSEKQFRKPRTPPDERIIVDFSNYNKECCTVQREKVEQVVGGVTATMKVGKDPCYCACECTFGFVKKTTYCDICGGFEIAGDEVKSQREGQLPFPCPAYQKTQQEFAKGKEVSKSKEILKGKDSTKGKELAKGISISDTKTKRSVESDKESKKSYKKRICKDERFKFNYGYQGIPPHIGHSQCAMPCTGTMGLVPKNMGWMWTADNIPGLKFRPNWKPGAAHKQVVRLLKIARYPEQVFTKKRKREVGKKKRPLKRPLLMVHKKDGEFTVTMETMKIFNRTRAPNQHPYEDKDPITYTIGRTEEENKIRQKKKERKARRLEREQRDFIQNTFRDMCEEICMKTYRQALGLLPHAEDPECACYPAEPTEKHTDFEHSCSCSDTLSSMGSDTDSDEWVVEFTPPNAIFNPNYVSKKVYCTDNGTQYSYLDYKVKLMDRYGNPVPRFFKGPDGKQQCSDLGGFWSPNHKWLEINVDGFIGPDERWAPNIFIGPDGEHVDGETGKFQIATGEWLVVGVDGYVDANEKWRYYSTPGRQKEKKRASKKEKMKDDLAKSEGTWSCFGDDVSPKLLSQMGIMGHGHDKKLLMETLQKMIDKGENVTIPKVPTGRRAHKGKNTGRSWDFYTDRMKCKHPTPSTKGIVAVDGHGRKIYFTLTDYKNQRPKERMTVLGSQGISLSSFHVPCLTSFINSEVMRQKQYEHIMEHNAKVMKTAGDQTD